MHPQLLLAVCFLGSILASPIPQDTCDAEMKRREECDRKLDHGIPQWWDDSFLKKLYPWQVYKDCIGEAKCEHVKRLDEFDETRYNVFVYLHINLRPCLGNHTLTKFWDICETPCQSKLPCEDRTDFDCMEGKIMQHEHCNAQDVKAFDDFVPVFIKFRNLFEEVWHGGRKCEGTMDEYKKAEIPKIVSRVALSSFFDVVRDIFTR